MAATATALDVLLYCTTCNQNPIVRPPLARASTTFSCRNCTRRLARKRNQDEIAELKKTAGYKLLMMDEKSPYQRKGWSKYLHKRYHTAADPKCPLCATTQGRN